MKRLYMQLRIGEKIAASFGLVGVLFLLVIWQYHETLNRSLADFQTLHEVVAAKKGRALLIENSMLKARRAERDFLLRRDEVFVTEVRESLDRVLAEAGELARLDQAGADAAGRIADLVQAYRQRFEALAQAWRIRGLDHNSGLQGAFRDTVHRLEAKAANFEVSGFYLQLLQIRRSEKDLGLRREVQYRDRVLGLVGALEAAVADSSLEQGFKQSLLSEVNQYREAFRHYADAVLAQQDIQGGKGPFRQVAHRIEDLLGSHHVPGLESNILQLRRREKDYLLRDDLQYVDLALSELKKIENRLQEAAIAATDKQALLELTDAYRRDFISLVAQNKEIGRLHADMRGAVSEVTRLVAENVRDAEHAMQESSASIMSSSQQSARFMLWVAGLAALLGIVSTVVITLSIARPLRRMAGLLDEVAYEVPIARIPVVPGGRDEVNAMGQSVNDMADHKARFLDWWKASMREAEAAQRAAAQPESNQATGEMAEAQQARRALAGQLREKVRELVRGVSEHARSIGLSHPHGKRLEDVLEIEKAAKSALAILDIMEIPKKGESMSRGGA